MKFQLVPILFFAIILIAPLVSHADKLVGKLNENPAGSGAFSLTVETNGQVLEIPLKFSATTAEESSSLVGKAPFVTVNGKWSGDKNSFKVSEVPTIIHGDVTLEGVLEVLGNGQFRIEGVPSVFGRTKVVNKASFDSESEKFFTQKKIIANGIMENGIFTIQSIMQAGVFSAAPADASALPRGFLKHPVLYAAGMVRGAARSPSPTWFRGTVYSSPNHRVKENDSVLIISASGAEKDSPGAVNGHFSVGRGTVGKDLEIRDGELFNVYVTNEKEITPGNVNMVDYYSHIISGQNNYRPTYTLVFYGLTPEKINAIRKDLDRFHPHFRAGNTKITSTINCTTLSVQAMGDIGFYGIQRNGENGTRYPILATQTQLPPKLTFAQQLKYAAETPRAEFMPGPAIVSILENINTLASQVGVTRVDFIFGGQTPSARPVGDGPTMSISNDLLKQAKVAGEIEFEGAENLVAKCVDAVGVKICK